MPADTTIPADAIAGLLDGWVGPVEYRDVRSGNWRQGALYYEDGGLYEVADPQRQETDSHAVMHLRLNCLRPEVQARVGSVLAAGVECPHCIEGQVMDSTAMHTGSPPVDTCRACNGSGWTRKPSPIYHLTDASRTGALSEQHIAEAVAWSVRSVARGGEVLAGIRGPWEPVAPLAETRPIITGRSITIVVCYWGWKAGKYRGPETGPEGRAKADAACLAANIATIDGGALVLPGGES